MEKPLVSVIIPTKNSEVFIEECLKSIVNQSFNSIELIVVDNNSTDRTKEIAFKYTNNVYNKGPERCSQRNYGAEMSKGKYVIFIDSDMQLSENVIKDCIDTKSEVVTIPEESFGTTFWAQCKRMEKSFYVNSNQFDGARFFEKAIFEKAGKYDEDMISGEDWDLHLRVKKISKSYSKVKSIIYHNEGNLKLINTMKKKYYYGQFIDRYFNKHSNEAKKQVNPLRSIYFSNSEKFLRNPIIFTGMIFMKVCEFSSFGLGYIKSKLR